MSKRYRFGVLVAVMLAPAGVLAGDLTPPGPPGATMRTLQEIYDILEDIKETIDYNAPVPKTGQTTSFLPGDDGAYQRGVAWPDPRFTVTTNGTDEVVTDNMTGFMWVQTPHDLDGNSGATNWFSAILFCNDLDFAGNTDWRLPNVRELQSLIDYGRSLSALPSEHPFAGISEFGYWTSSTLAGFSDYV